MVNLAGIAGGHGGHEVRPLQGAEARRGVLHLPDRVPGVDMKCRSLCDVHSHIRVMNTQEKSMCVYIYARMIQELGVEHRDNDLSKSTQSVGSSDLRIPRPAGASRELVAPYVNQDGIGNAWKPYVSCVNHHELWGNA